MKPVYEESSKYNNFTKENNNNKESLNVRISRKNIKL